MKTVLILNAYLKISIVARYAYAMKHMHLIDKIVLYYIP